MISAAQAAIGIQYDFLTHRAGSPSGTARSHYQLSGPATAPLVVLVSGATLPLAVWGPLVEPLVSRGFRVLRYDLPGRGLTPVAGIGVDFDAHLAQLSALLDGLSIVEPIRLVGLASGALIAAAFAQRHPERIARLGLIAPDGTATRFTPIERLLVMPGIGHWLFRAIGRSSLLGRVPRYSSREDVRQFVRALLEYSIGSPGFHDGVLGTVRTFPLHGGEGQYLALARAGLPTCVVWGDRDGITPPDAAPALTAAFGSDAVKRMAGVGHLPFVEEPEATAEYLAGQLRA